MCRFQDPAACNSTEDTAEDVTAKAVGKDVVVSVLLHGPSNGCIKLMISQSVFDFLGWN